jgi:hypothetical protein
MRLEFKPFLLLLTIQIGCMNMPLTQACLPKLPEMHLRRFTGFATVHRSTGGSLETLCSIDLWRRQSRPLRTLRSSLSESDKPGPCIGRMN